MAIPSISVPFTYTAAPSDALVVSGITPIRYQDAAPQVTDSLGEPNTCALTGGSAEDATRLGLTHEPPVVGQAVTVDVLGRRTFAGTVVQTTLTYQLQPHQLKWGADLVDPTRAFNRLIPFSTYTAESATTVVQHLVTNYAPGFTTDHVELGLPAITVDFSDGAKNLGECLDAICELLGIPRGWKVDYDDDVHLTLVPEVDEVPDDLVDGSPTLQLDQPLTFTRDVTQLRNRVFVRGTACFGTADDAASQALYGDWEAPVISRPELTTEAACIAYGQTVLATYAYPIDTLTYTTRDPKTASGKTVTVNLTNPPVVGEFLIQTVRIDQIAVHGTTYPRYSVTAGAANAVPSPVRFTYQDVVRRYGMASA
jgi:hypothetical protein